MKTRALTTSELAKALVEKRGLNSGMSMNFEFKNLFRGEYNVIPFYENEKTGDSSVRIGQIFPREGGAFGIYLPINYSKLKAVEKKEVVEFLKSEGLI